MHDQRGRSPLLAGLSAARANLVPGVVIQAAMLLLVLAYYDSAPTKHVLNVLAEWKGRYGYVFTFLVLGLTGGLFPEILRVAIFQHGKINKGNFYDVAFAFPFWGMMGCVTDTFYRYQAMWFGTQVTVLMLTKKVALDMLVFTPLWGTPAVVCGLTWQRSGFTADIRSFFSWQFYRSTVVPVLVANWGVWVPAVTIIYSLPLLLQVPLFALTNSFWSLLVTYMARDKPVPIGPP